MIKNPIISTYKLIYVLNLVSKLKCSGKNICYGQGT